MPAGFAAGASGSVFIPQIAGSVASVGQGLLLGPKVTLIGLLGIAKGLPKAAILAPYLVALIPILIKVPMLTLFAKLSLTSKLFSPK